ncbi:unnamed protein product [Sphagnum balticum]
MVAVPLLLAVLVYQSGILLTPRLSVSLVVAVPLLLALLVCQPDMGLYMLLAVAVPLLVCQSGTGLYVLLAVAVPLLQWTCGLDSSAGDQRQEEVVKSRLGNLHLKLSPTE